MMLRMAETNVMKPMIPLCSNDMGLTRRRMDPASVAMPGNQERSGETEASEEEPLQFPTGPAKV